MKNVEYESIDDYIKSFPVEIQKKLQDVRSVIHKAAPEAREKISYQMPTFDLHGNLIHFAAFKNHIGLYPAPSGITEFEKELSVYKYAKGSVRFPIDKPLRLKLIARIAEYRVKENIKKYNDKAKKNK